VPADKRRVENWTLAPSWFILRATRVGQMNVHAANINRSNIMETTVQKYSVQPYLFFDGRCDEAIEFYRKALGAEVLMLMRFRDSPEPTQHAPGAENKVMHASLRIGETTVSVSDGRCQGKPNFAGFALTLNVTTEATAEWLFAALSPGGQVQMPLAKTFFSRRFGMVTDRFGVLWMIRVAT
jgi:PhnB protein